MTIASRCGGASRSTRLPIVVPAGAGTVELRGVSGPIDRPTPDEEPVQPASPMQNAQNAFRTGLWTAHRTRRPQAAQAVSFSLETLRRTTCGRHPNTRRILRPLLCSSLRSDERTACPESVFTIPGTGVQISRNAHLRRFG